MIWAGNATVEFERETEPGGWSDHLGLEHGGGRLQLAENERLEMRLKIGVDL